MQGASAESERERDGGSKGGASYAAAPSWSEWRTVVPMPPDPRPNNKRWQKRTRQRLRTHGTPAEAFLWLALKRRQLHGFKFRRQFGVGPYILDFYCPAARLAIELDGAVHDDPARRAYDAERTRHLEGEGIRVLRFENRLAFEQRDAVLEAIEKALWERGA